ncbi:DUF3499 family protein [Arcanobacterium hippocoleae]|uniref:Uncharacterized protein n=1 Tax=Arcanobacterium hippocoleae TaxID=149017 RepID=A0ABU1T1P5_9ACTO|nr:hypothetical protein [Arcanobacterium hippocoleae]
MTSSYAQATAVIGPLSPTPQAGTFDFCAEHALSVTVPIGWQLVRLVTEFAPAEPSHDDLTALADAIREASRRDVPAPQPARRDVPRPNAHLNVRPELARQRHLEHPSQVTKKQQGRPNLEIIDGGQTE